MDGEVHGEWGDMARDRSWYTGLVALHPGRARLAAATLLAATLIALRRRR